MQRYRAVLALTVLCVVSAFSQEKPNFTGTWKQVGLSGRTRIDRIEHQDPRLKVATESRDTPTTASSIQRPLAMITAEHEYRTDGEEQVDKNPNGRQRWITASWQGSALVFTTAVRDGYRVMVTRETWTLSDAGNTLTKATRIVSMDGVNERTVTFRKQ